MEIDQEQTFRFDVVTNAGEGELWVRLFVDDIGSIDLGVYSAPEVIERFRLLVVAQME